MLPNLKAQSKWGWLVAGYLFLAGLGGARGTNEEAYVFGKFLRVAIGTNHIDAQLGDGLDPAFLAGVVPRATIDDLEREATNVRRHGRRRI